MGQQGLLQLTEEDLKKQKELKMKPRKQLLVLITTLHEEGMDVAVLVPAEATCCR